MVNSIVEIQGQESIETGPAHEKRKDQEIKIATSNKQPDPQGALKIPLRDKKEARRPTVISVSYSAVNTSTADKGLQAGDLDYKHNNMTHYDGCLSKCRQVQQVQAPDADARTACARCCCTAYYLHAAKDTTPSGEGALPGTSVEPGYSSLLPDDPRVKEVSCSHSDIGVKQGGALRDPERLPGIGSHNLWAKPSLPRNLPDDPCVKEVSCSHFDNGRNQDGILGAAVGSAIISGKQHCIVHMPVNLCAAPTHEEWLTQQPNYVLARHALEFYHTGRTLYIALRDAGGQPRQPRKNHRQGRRVPKTKKWRAPKTAPVPKATRSSAGRLSTLRMNPLSLAAEKTRALQLGRTKLPPAPQET